MKILIVAALLGLAACATAPNAPGAGGGNPRAANHGHVSSD